MGRSHHWLGFLPARTGRPDQAEQEHRRVIELYARFGRTDVPPVAEGVAKPCLVAPAGAVDDLGPVQKLAERAVAGNEKHGSYRGFLLVKAMAEYRAGRDAEAVNWLGKYAPRDDGVHGDASAFALLAMARHRTGRAQAAAEALQKAKAIIAEKLPDPAEGTTRPRSGMAPMERNRSANPIPAAAGGAIT